MTTTGMTFDYISLIILAFLFFFYRSKRKGALLIYKVCYVLLAVMAVTCLSHILLFLLVRNQMSVGTVMIVRSFLGITLCIFLITFSVYILCLCKINVFREIKSNLMVVLPAVVMILFYALSPLTGVLLSYDNEYVVHMGPMYYLTFLFVVYYLVYWLVLSQVFRDTLSKDNQRYICLFVLIGIITMVVYYITRNVSFPIFCCTMLLMMVMYDVRNPDDIYDVSGALKRSYFYDYVNINYKRQKPFDVIFIKITDVRRLNDTFGTMETNRLLRNIVEYLGNRAKHALVFRLERNLFALKLDNINEEILTTIRTELEERFGRDWHSGDIVTRLPAGLVTMSVPKDAENMHTFREMIHFLINSKIEFRTNKLISEMHDAGRELEVLAAVKKAVDNNGFKVYYQPIYSTNKKKIVAAEALIRLFDDKLGFISPEEFIPLAEREGYILDIGRFVFEEVCRYYSENKLNEKGVDYIEVNLSAIQCMKNQLAEEFIGIMEKYNITTDRINFEITETSAMISNSAVKVNMNCFVDNGIDLSLDDYGTGYSNLSYLYRMPFSFVKIDKSILWSAEKNEKADITLSNIFKMAKNLKMRVVVEGVETEEHIKKLLDLNCDYFQGYYFSKPIPGADFIEYLRGFSIPEVCK